jgi:hypothetical protein
MLLRSTLQTAVIFLFPPTVSFPTIYSAFDQDILLVCLIGFWELKSVPSIYQFDRLMFVSGTVCIFCDLGSE